MRKVPVLLSLALATSSLVATSSADAQVPKPPKPVKYGYVVSNLVVPTNNNQARELAVDIDKDGEVDNQMGQVFGTLASQGIDVQGAVDAMIASGSVITLLSVQTTSLKNAKGAKVRLFKGKPKVDPDYTDGRFSVDKTAPSAELKAKIVNKVLVPKAGKVPVVIPGLFNTGPTLSVHLTKGVVIAKCTKKRCTGGIIAGAITQSDIDTRLIPSMGGAARAAIAADCTGTTEETCAEMSTGKTMMTLFDANDDGLVTDQEVHDNSLIQSLLAPDLDLNKDGTGDALSFGVGFTANAAKVKGD